MSTPSVQSVSSAPASRGKSPSPRTNLAAMLSSDAALPQRPPGGEPAESRPESPPDRKSPLKEDRPAARRAASTRRPARPAAEPAQDAPAPQADKADTAEPAKKAAPAKPSFSELMSQLLSVAAGAEPAADPAAKAGKATPAGAADGVNAVGADQVQTPAAAAPAAQAAPAVQASPAAAAPRQAANAVASQTAVAAAKAQVVASPVPQGAPAQAAVAGEVQQPPATPAESAAQPPQTAAAAEGPKPAPALQSPAPKGPAQPPAGAAQAAQNSQSPAPDGPAATGLAPEGPAEPPPAPAPPAEPRPADRPAGLSLQQALGQDQSARVVVRPAARPESSGLDGEARPAGPAGEPAAPEAAPPPLLHAAQAAAAQAPAGRADAPPAVDASAARIADARDSLAGQIASALPANPRDAQEIVIRLDPPSLGQVRIRLTSERGEIVGVLEVSRASTLRQLEQESASLIQRLADQGVQMRRLDLSLSDQAPNQGQDGSNQQWQQPWERPQPLHHAAASPGGQARAGAARVSAPAAETGGGLNFWV